MSHPNSEQWMSYLYDELDSAERASLSAHLQGCQDCKAKVSDWRATRKNLDTWRLAPVKRRRAAFAPPVFKWAAAAALCLCVGFGVGRLTSATVSVEKLRAAIEPQLRQEVALMLRRELDQTAAATLRVSSEQTKALLADYAAAAATKRAEDNSAVFTALNKLDAQRIADYLSLKKDVDTVAINTDAGLRSTQRELIQLADYTPSGGNSNSKPK